MMNTGGSQEIVRESNVQQRSLLVEPPTGLLQLGKQRAALRYLEPILHVRFFPLGGSSPM